jgi:thioesterase domain-containing protein/acyl carrier protein
LERPPDPLVAQLADIWRELLGVWPTGIQDNFFDLGGHSLLAARMVHEVEQALGVSVPLSALFIEPTIAHLARLLHNQCRDDFASLATLIRQGGARLPLWFLHGDYNGGGFYLWKLAKGLATDRPVYALHPHGLAGGPIPPTIEAMAASYLPLIQRLQPQGPYVLAGFCNGGLVAFELAQRLRRRGHVVALVAMIHVGTPNVRHQTLRHVVRCFRPVRALAQMAHHCKSALTRGWRRAALSQRSASVKNELYRHAITRYIPRPYPGPVALITREHAESEEDPTLAWKSLAADLAVYRLPGDHLSAVTSHCHILAQRLEDCLQTARV